MKMRPSISEHQYLNRGITTAAGPDDSGKKVVRYVMLVKDISTNETWKVDHRYSDFLRLRKSLLKQKFYSIPTIKSKSSLLHQQVTVIKDRAIVLQRFINDCIHIVGLSNITLNGFLINGDHYSSSSKNERYSHFSNRSSHGLHPYDDVPSQMGSTRGRSFRVITPAILSSKTIPSNFDSDLLQVDSKSYLSTSSLRAVWDHVYALPISLCGNRSQCLQHNNALIDKLISLERQVTALQQSLLIEKERSSSPLLGFLYRSLYRILGIEEIASEQKVRAMTINAVNDNTICGTVGLQTHYRRNWLLIVEVLLFRSFLTFVAFELLSCYIPHVEYYHSYDIPSMTIKQSILNVSPTLTSTMNPEGQSIPKGLFKKMFPGALAWLLNLTWSSSRYSYLHDMISQLFHLFIKVVAFFCIFLPGNQNIRKQLLWLILFFITMHTLYFAHCHGVLQQLKQSIHTLVTSVQIYSEQDNNQQILSRLINQASRRLAGTINVVSNEFGNWGSNLILFIFIDFLPFLFNILLSDVMIISFKCILFCENIVFEVKNVLLDIAIVSQKTFIASFIFLFLSIGFIYFFFQYKYSARALYLYLLGTVVMIIYLWVTLIGMIFEDILSNQTKQSLFQQMDVLIAPFVVSRLKQHKSIFIKFGQYLSNKTSAFSSKVNEERNGNVMKLELPLSNIWFHYLQQLQDDCEFDDISSTQHHSCLKTIVEKQLNKVYEKVVLDKSSVTGSSATVLKSSEPIKLEDIFESFDPVPVASASVGQVHFATLNVAKLSNIRCKSSSEHEDGKSTLDKTLGDSSNEIVSLSELIDREKQKFMKQFYTIPWFSSFAHASPVTDSNPCGNLSAAASRWRWKPYGDYSVNVLKVAVKIQHIDIEDIMLQDMKVFQSLVFVASLFDVRWKVSCNVVVPYFVPSVSYMFALLISPSGVYLNHGIQIWSMNWIFGKRPTTWKLLAEHSHSLISE